MSNEPKGNTTFETDVDLAFIVGGHDREHEPALLINPGASLSTLLAATNRRAKYLHQQLNAWACVLDAPIDAQEIATFLEPAAHEIALLMEAASERARHDEAHHG